MASFWECIQYKNGGFTRVWGAWVAITETQGTIYTGFLCNSSRISRKYYKYIYKVSFIFKNSAFIKSRTIPTQKNVPPQHIYKTALTNIFKKLRTSLQNLWGGYKVTLKLL